MHGLDDGDNTILSCNLYNERDISLSIGGTSGFHCHKGLELCYIHNGNGRCVINEETYYFKKNSVLFFRPFQIHGFFPQADNVFSRSIIVADIALLMHASAALPQIKRFISFLHSDEANMQCIQDENGGIEALLHLALPVSQKNGGNMPAEDALLLYQGILKMLSYQQNAICSGKNLKEKQYIGSGVEYVNALIKWVDGNFEKEYSLDELSARMGVSKFYLTRLFKKHTGRTISEYIMKRRLREAKILLYTSQLTVTEIACKTGFPNLSYFCQVFRRDTGLTPSEFRMTNSERLA